MSRRQNVNSRAVVLVASLASVAVVGGAAAAVPLSAVRAVSQCSAAPDTMDCLLRAAAAGVDTLARSAEPVDLVAGCVTLVKNAAEAAPHPPATDTTAADVSDVRVHDGSSSTAAEEALVDSVTAFAKSRAISVRAPAHWLDSLKNTLTEGDFLFSFFHWRSLILRCTKIISFPIDKPFWIDIKMEKKKKLKNH